MKDKRGRERERRRETRIKVGRVGGTGRIDWLDPFPGYYSWGAGGLVSFYKTDTPTFTGIRHSIGKRVPCALGYVPRSDLSAGINKRAAVRANS